MHGGQLGRGMGWEMVNAFGVVGVCGRICDWVCAGDLEGLHCHGLTAVVAASDEVMEMALEGG